MNTTIECVVLGDPVPSVTWYKDSLPVDGHVTDVQREQATKADSVVTRSFLYLSDVTLAHTGDYR
jgi:Immunoglobulin domain